MSQAKNIYDYLAKSGNPAADDLLNLALNLSDEPYKSAIFETIIDRGRSKSSAGIIAQYHLMDPARQAMIVMRAADLNAPLCQAITSQDAKARENAVDIISKSRDCRLGNALVLLLRSGNYHLTSQATLVMVKTIDTFVNENPFWYVMQRAEVIDDFERQMANRGASVQLSEADKRQYMLTSIKEALDIYATHRRSELIPAAMMITDARDEQFWKFGTSITSSVTEVVLNLIGHEKRPKMAYFICSALKVQKLRNLVLANLEGKNSPEFISSLAMAYSVLKKDKEISRWIKLVKKPVWLTSESVPLAGIPRDHQRLLIDLIEDIGADQTLKAQWAYNSLAHVDSRCIFSLIGMIAKPTNTLAIDMLKNINMSQNEDVAFEALKHIIFLKPPELLTIVGKHLNSRHPKVRELATRVYQNGAFDIFWKKFEKLDHKSQEKAAKAIFKLTEDNHKRWEAQAGSHDPAMRLKALKVLKNSGLLEKHLETLTNMISDRDPFVRSLAVSLVGHSTELQEKVENVLVFASSDKDPRVKANAIESLDTIHSKWAVDIALQHTESDIPRVRANAIKVLISHQVDNAWLFFRKMLADKRPGHKRSANWLVHNSGLTDKSSKQ